MGKNRNKTLNIPIPTLTWKLIWLIVLVILAFRLETKSVSLFLEWALNKFISN